MSIGCEQCAGMSGAQCFELECSCACHATMRDDTAQAAHNERVAFERDASEVSEALLRLVRVYESECEPWPRPAWVESAVAAAGRVQGWVGP